MNFCIQKWSLQMRSLFCGKRLLSSYGRKSPSVLNGLSFYQNTKSGLLRAKTSQANIQIGSSVFRPTQTCARSWECYTSPTRVFHTSIRRPIPPVLWIFIKPIAKITAALTGRGIRKWFQSLGPAERQKVWAAIRRRWYIPAGVCVIFAGYSAIYYVSHIQETPVTGRKRFVALTHDQIVAIAEAEAAELIAAYGGKLYTDKDPQSMRVLQVAHRLLAANPELKKMPFKQWQIYVIRDPLVNACVLPSGHMFVFDGILETANTQDQLAIILGHEMAHAVLEHGIEELSMGRFVDVFVILCLAAIWCIIPIDGFAVITHWFYDKVIKLLTHMPHSRTLEKEADKVGLMFAAKACYDIRQGSVLWTKMSLNEKLGDASSNILPEWMLTHPDSLKRAGYLDFLQPEAEKWREEMKCPKLPTQDPREAIRVLSEHYDNMIIANKTGQDLRRVTHQPGLIIRKN